MNAGPRKDGPGEPSAQAMGGGAAGAASRDVFVARQPICDRDLQIRAYELLHRREGGTAADFVDGDQASIEVALNTLLDIGLDPLVGQVPAYLNATRRVLTDGLFRLFPQHRVVIEVLESVAPDEEVEAALEDARRRGYRVALDDYIPDDPRERLLPLADVVKVDCAVAGMDAAVALAPKLRRPGLLLLAEKVETTDEYRRLRDAGYDLFQGYFFCKPELHKSRSLAPNRLSLLRLISFIEDPRRSFRDVEDVVRHDLSLSYKLMRLVNAAVFSLHRPVESLRHALVMLGLHRIRECVCLLLLSTFSDKPRALLLVALQRAKLCQRFAEMSGQADPEKAFTVGLFSTLDALMDERLEAILKELPLAADLKAALLREEGVLGRMLHEARRCETAGCSGGGEFGVGMEDMQTAYLEALAWVGDMEGVIG